MSEDGAVYDAGNTIDVSADIKKAVELDSRMRRAIERVARNAGDLHEGLRLWAAVVRKIDAAHDGDAPRAADEQQALSPKLAGGTANFSPSEYISFCGKLFGAPFASERQDPAPPAAPRVAGLVRALEAAVAYLDANSLSVIGAGSILHRQMREALDAHPAYWERQGGGL